MAKGDIPLAKEYHTFLKKSKNELDLDVRIKSLDIRAGMAVSEIENVYLFLSGVDSDEFQSTKGTNQ